MDVLVLIKSVMWRCTQCKQARDLATTYRIRSI